MAQPAPQPQIPAHLRPALRELYAAMARMAAAAWLARQAKERDA